MALSSEGGFATHIRNPKSQIPNKSQFNKFKTAGSRAVLPRGPKTTTSSAIPINLFGWPHSSQNGVRIQGSNFIPAAVVLNFPLGIWDLFGI